MSNQDIVDKLLLNKSELKKFKKDYSKVNKKLFEDLKEKRDMLRIASQRSTLEYKLFEDKYLLPVNLYRLAQEYSSKGGNSKIDFKVDDSYIKNFLNCNIWEVANKKETQSKVFVKELPLLNVVHYLTNEYKLNNPCLPDY